MPHSTPFMILPKDREAFHALREKAAGNPIDLIELQKTLRTPDGDAAYRRQMCDQTVDCHTELPGGYSVSFSIETGQPIGPCRHLSIAMERADRLPSPEAMWMVAEEFGFSGGLEACHSWPEQLIEGRVAINLVQPLRVMGEAR